MVHLHNMRTRHKNRHVIAEMFKKKTVFAMGKNEGLEIVRKPSPSDSVRKSNASELKVVFGAEVVGRKIAVFWRKEGEWFPGRIDKYTEKTRTHTIKYEDGERQEICLAKQRFQFLTNPKQGSAPNPSYMNAPRGKEAIGQKVRVFWPAMCKWYVGRIKDYDKATGKHLIAYQDGEQQNVLLRNEAVKYPSMEASKVAHTKDKADVLKSKPAKMDKQTRSSTHRGKRVAADCRVHHQDLESVQTGKRKRYAAESTQSESKKEDASAGKTPKLHRNLRSASSKHEEDMQSKSEEGTSQSKGDVEEASMDQNLMAYRAESSTDNSEDSSRLIESPKTPDNEHYCMLGNQQALHETSKSEEQETSCEVEPMSFEEDGQDSPEEKEKCGAFLRAEEAKAKALHAQELAAVKAEAAAKALAAVKAAAVKTDAPSEDRPVKDAVGWRVGVWSVGEHKYFKGQITNFQEDEGKYEIQYDNGNTDHILLQENKIKWLQKTVEKTPCVAKPTVSHTKQAVQTPAMEQKDTKELVGKFVNIIRGSDRITGEVIAYSLSRQRHLVLFMDSKHEWVDFRKGNWDICSEKPVKPAHIPNGIAAVGWRVAVFWAKNEKFFQGVISSFEPSSGQYLIHYDDGDQYWVDFKIEKVKWLSKPTAKAGKASLAVKSSKSLSKVQEGVTHEAHELISGFPEVFTVSALSQPSEKLDVLSNIHNANGLTVSLEELSSRNKSQKPIVHSHILPGIDEACGVTVQDTAKVEYEDSSSMAEHRVALYHRLQTLEFMLEHSGHVEQSLMYSENIQDDQVLQKKEDIQLIGSGSFSMKDFQENNWAIT